MKSTSSYILSVFALVAGTSAQVSSYQLRVVSQTPAIKDAILTLKDASGNAGSPNALGVWSTGEPRSAYTFTISAAASDARFYELKSSVTKTQLTLWGNKVAMGLYDVPIGSKLDITQDEAAYNDKYTTMGTMVRHAQDFNSSSEPSGGAGSWRACKGDSEVDYQIYWYDGSSPLPIKNCEGVGLDLVPSTPTPAASATGTAVDTATGTTVTMAATGSWITGVAAPTSTWIIGVTAPTGTWVTGVAAPTGTWVGGENTTAPSGPAQFPGAASHIEMAGGLISLALGVFALLL